MRPTPIENAAPPERRPAIWPWLLVPLVALVMFFALSRLRESNAQPTEPQPPAAAAEPVSTG